MSKNDEILISSEEGVKTITLNIPKKKNPLSPANAILVAKEFEQSAEDGTRVVILTGAGGSFCAGAALDAEGFLKGPEKRLPVEEDNDRMVDTSFHRLIRAVCGLERPVIAAVDGAAAGFGCSLALHCDLTLASTTARFIEVFVNIALIPDGGSTYILPKLVGMKKAMEMAFTGDPVLAEEALQLNMVNRVYPPEELMEKAQEWGARLARGPVKTMGVAKKTMYEAQQMNYRDVLDMECRRQARMMTRPDFVNAVTAFLVKKKPTFS